MKFYFKLILSTEVKPKSFLSRISLFTFFCYLVWIYAGKGNL